MTTARRVVSSLLLMLPAYSAAQSEAADRVQASLPAQLLILFGVVFIVAAGIGMLRFPDFYIRLHASTKLVTLGGLGILAGAALAFSDAGGADRAILIGVFFLLTAPLSGYMIARAGYLSGTRPLAESTSVDEWGACGESSKVSGGDGLDA